MMRELDHRNYYAARLAQARAMALAAKDPAIRTIHAEMAATYEILAERAPGPVVLRLIADEAVAAIHAPVADKSSRRA